MIFSSTIRQYANKLKTYNSFIEQLDFRFGAINVFIQKDIIDLKKVNYFIGRGG
ncbi:MAG: hypothetical protein ACYCXB_02720 [Candidatus Humimicrobiaceae bacterium]